MFLSRVEIDLTDRRNIKELTHLGAYHNWVEQCFPNEIKQSNRTRKLWRIDRLNGKSYLLILSETPPSLIEMEKYGVQGSAQTKDYNDHLGKLKKGGRMRFRIVVNPVHSVMEKGKRGIEKPHITSFHQIQYFMDRTEKNGFHVDENEIQLVERNFELLRKPGQKPIRVVKAVFEGVLTITDLELFIQVLTHGMGKKKAYGFGLITVIPLEDNGRNNNE